MIPFAKPYVNEEMKKEVLSIMDSGMFIQGEKVKALEETFSKFCQAKYGIGVASGTAALHLALLALGISPGDEVITAPNSFVATANAILYCGAKPVFADIDPDTYCIDPEKVKGLVTEKTKAIIPVHLFGHPVDMDPILELAEEKGLDIVEDACQAHGAEYKGKRTGSIGRIGCFSFYPIKNVGVAGDGGIMVTSDEEIVEKLRSLRSHGEPQKNVHADLGYNYRLSEINAAVASCQMKDIDKLTDRRREIAKKYGEELKGVVLPQEKEWAKHVYHLYVVRSENRDKLREFLWEDEIGTGIHYPTPIPLQPYMQERGYKAGTWPLAEKYAREILSLPMFPQLTDEQVETVIGKVSSFDGG